MLGVQDLGGGIILAGLHQSYPILGLSHPCSGLPTPRNASPTVSVCCLVLNFSPLAVTAQLQHQLNDAGLSAGATYSLGGTNMLYGTL